jgi:flagellum-specific ATP synthase
MAMRFKQLYSKYRQNEDLINVGAYVKGSDPDTDFVMENLPSIGAYLRQGMNESFTLKESMQQMIMVISAPPTPQAELNQQIRRPVSNGLQK